ncbi:MAG: hypothetical protein IJ566_04085 [Cardiobacteriaceae bacterium]|nr:hypothetical protein [Cardiobacteriaceae bacterium]
MNNQTFLNVLKQSFLTYLQTHARSNEKLKVLHGRVAQDIDNKIKDKNTDKANYTVSALGFNNGKEEKIQGRYIEKMVDITIKNNNHSIAGIAVKYVMSNYFQNSNNYFENMLGETANIRCNQKLYFQILVIPEKLPYFDNNGKITKWEIIDKHHLEKYIQLSQDDKKQFFHTPDKTLLCIINISEPKTETKNKQDYINYYLNNDFSIQLSNKQFNFDNAVIFNDYEKFINKVVFSILSI